MAPISLRASYLLLALTVAGSACTSSRELPTSSEIGSQLAARHPVIVDYSPTVSDVGALLYLLSNPAVDVVAITMPVTGEAGCDLGLEVTLGILAMYERADIPVACDPERPPDAENWPVAFLAGQESLSSGLPAPTGAVADPRPAHQLIADIAASADQPVVLYAVAPLTNIARALDRHPNLAAELDRIVIMGGAVDVPGNVEGTGAEWNFWIDVPAAVRVLASGAQITLVPLDATNDVPVPLTWKRDLRRAEQTDPVVYLSSLVETFPSVTSGFFFLWDELAASVAAGGELVDNQALNLTVVDEPGPMFGSTVRDPSGALVLVATGVPDRNSFYAHFLRTLQGSPGETTVSPTSEGRPGAGDPGPATVQEEVLTYWLLEAMAGNVATAAEVVAPGASWTGLSESADVFAEGSAPYEVSAIDVTCTTEGSVATCDVTWDDVWISATRDLDRGSLRVGAEVVDGLIVAFREFAFGPGISAAYDEHLAWLAVEMQALYEQACSADAAAKQCSELLVATVEEWMASR